ncbi:MAG: riboflavin synthase [Gemmataceae bacterium]|nr:riboflavin synthase [Gemmataceae bacterium]
MFTGLVEALGTVREARDDGAGRVLRIDETTVAGDLPLGASVAVNGVCLTVVERDQGGFVVQVGPETLRCTNLGELRGGDRVNLERPLRVGDRLGGHIVQGHVDGMGRLERRERQGDWEMIWFTCEPALSKHMVRKGSIAVDGVSLTLVDVTAGGFSVALIPHTLQMTTLGFKQPPATVNLETDYFAKIIVKYMSELPIPGH